MFRVEGIKIVEESKRRLRVYIISGLELRAEKAVEGGEESLEFREKKK